MSDRGRVEGAVLCGGRSTRMGTDKAQLVVGGRTLLDRSIAALEPLCERVILACGPEARYADAGLDLAIDRFAEAGPLAGLHAALAESARGPCGGTGAEWLLCVACDMPRVEPMVLSALLERARTLELDACLFATGAGLEPLYAVYRTSCLAAVEAALVRGERRLISFHGDVRVGQLDEIELSEALRARRSQINLNTPAELSSVVELTSSVVVPARECP